MSGTNYNSNRLKSSLSEIRVTGSKNALFLPFFRWRSCRFSLAFSHSRAHNHACNHKNHKNHEISVSHHDEAGGTLLTSFRSKLSKSTYSTRSAALRSFYSGRAPLLAKIAPLSHAQPHHQPPDDINDNNPQRS